MVSVGAGNHHRQVHLVGARVLRDGEGFHRTARMLGEYLLAELGLDPAGFVAGGFLGDIQLIVGAYGEQQRAAVIGL
ncbi:hypothetical protein D3C85_908060 [compost metagenome]